MKKITLLLAAFVLTGCASQQETAAPVAQAESATSCVTECEIFHGGYVRGCRANGFAGLNRAQWNTCMDAANKQLNDCYSSCE